MTGPLDPMEVRRVEDANGSHVEPPFDVRWTHATQLRWKAAVTALDSGLTVAVYRQPHPGLFGVRVGSSSVAPLDFGAAADFLTGVVMGAREARRQEEHR